MRDPKRIKRILNLIEEIWTEAPDLRLCQLIGNVAPYDNYHVEDDDLAKRLVKGYSPLPKKAEEKKDSPEEFSDKLSKAINKMCEQNKTVLKHEQVYGTVCNHQWIIYEQKAMVSSTLFDSLLTTKVKCINCGEIREV